MASTEPPRRGEIWLVSLGAARKGEPGKNRPAIVVSADGLLAGTEDELVVVPLLTARAPSRLRPPVSPESGIDVESAAIPRGIRAVSRRRLLRRLGELDADTAAEVDRALMTVLALEAPV